jgi:hypothetical protein
MWQGIKNNTSDIQIKRNVYDKDISSIEEKRFMCTSEQYP